MKALSEGTKGSCTEHGMDLSGSPSSVLSLFLGSPSSLFVKVHNHGILFFSYQIVSL
ncbi:hypothetical protein LR48_Vigan03g114400 [Vigna angularis]|uniref:Uncharacterized protein n=1 Tax=Phaseolus angularis TaxID=3914 RepID=A0A0L9U507_PHAAN|nr:hypothetical protein LR48_Vigan03g114400 [Vigna angularis]